MVVLPCFKLVSASRIDANSAEIQIRYWLGDGVGHDERFIATDATGLNTVAKLGAIIRLRVLSYEAARVAVPPAPTGLAAFVGNVYDCSGTPSLVDDPGV